MEGSNPFDAHGVCAANEQRLEAPVETAETDQPVPAVVVIEQGEIAPWLEVAEVAGPLVSERTAASSVSLRGRWTIYSFPQNPRS